MTTVECYYRDKENIYPDILNPDVSAMKATQPRMISSDSFFVKCRGSDDVRNPSVGLVIEFLTASNPGTT